MLLASLPPQQSQLQHAHQHNMHTSPGMQARLQDYCSLGGGVGRHVCNPAWIQLMFASSFDSLHRLCTNININMQTGWRGGGTQANHAWLDAAACSFNHVQSILSAQSGLRDVQSHRSSVQSVGAHLSACACCVLSMLLCVLLQVGIYSVCTLGLQSRARCLCGCWWCNPGRPKTQQQLASW